MHQVSWQKCVIILDKKQNQTSKNERGEKRNLVQSWVQNLKLQFIGQLTRIASESWYIPVVDFQSGSILQAGWRKTANSV